MCPLCGFSQCKSLLVQSQEYLHCGVCDLRSLAPAFRLNAVEEKERYHLHERGDAGYFKFVEPLIERLRDTVAPGAHGLDFGAGQYPMLSQWLVGRGYHMSLYDPFFWPEPVSPPFDFIVSCEVVEHLFAPAAEFRRLRQWLRPGAPLVLMTDLVRPQTDFANWYYRRDPTHVSFYSETSFRWLAGAFGFENVQIEERVVSLW